MQRTTAARDPDPEGEGEDGVSVLSKDALSDVSGERRALKAERLLSLRPLRDGRAVAAPGGQPELQPTAQDSEETIVIGV